MLIGHAGHPEVEGTMGQLPPGAMHPGPDRRGGAAWCRATPANLAFITQTTLSVDDTAEIVAALRRALPGRSSGRKSEDICYATTNRQEAVKAMAPRRATWCWWSARANSSNSLRLREVGRRPARRGAKLIDDGRRARLAWFEGVETVGLTAGASAPELLVQGVLARAERALRHRDRGDRHPPGDGHLQAAAGDRAEGRPGDDAQHRRHRGLTAAGLMAGKPRLFSRP